jgi:transcriptional antiterminator RfaH
MLNWYVVMAKPKQDELAAQHLAAQNYQVYLPRCRVEKTLRGKKVHRIESLFPRYLFVKLDDQNQDWGPIRSTRGVMQMLRFGLNPARVSDDLIDSIKRQEQLALNNQAQNALKEGDVVRVESGAFYGLDGIFYNYDADQRVILLMTILGQPQKLTFELTEVEKLAQ